MEHLNMLYLEKIKFKSWEDLIEEKEERKNHWLNQTSQRIYR